MSEDPGIQAYLANENREVIHNCTALCMNNNGSDVAECTCDVTLDDLTFAFAVYGVLVPTLFGIITLLGIIGNSLVLYVILSKQNMRTVTNLLLMNLAIADLSFVCVCPPFTAYQMAFSRWPFGQLACKLMHDLINVTAYVTVYTLVAISVLRYMTIVHNSETRHLRTRKNVVITIIAMWLVFLILNIPVTLSYHLEDTGYEDDVICDIINMQSGKRIFGTFFFFAYLLPLGVIGVFSICILRHIQKQKPSSLEGAHQVRSRQRRQQASRLIILVVILFAVLWLPVHIQLLLFYYATVPYNHAYTLFSILAYCLAYFNSCVNPIIYHVASHDFRDSFRKALCCERSRGPDTHAEHTTTKKICTEEPCVHTHLVAAPVGNGTKKDTMAIEDTCEMVDCADV